MTESLRSTIDFLLADARGLRDTLHQTQLTLAETQALLRYRTEERDEAVHLLHKSMAQTDDVMTIATQRTQERDAARAEADRLRTMILRHRWWEEPGPCPLCGYNDGSYYQSDGPHECARLTAALEARESHL